MSPESEPDLGCIGADECQEAILDWIRVGEELLVQRVELRHLVIRHVSSSVRDLLVGPVRTKAEDG